MEIKDIIKESLEEDIKSGDVTTNSIVPEKKLAKANILSKEKGILCGINVAEMVFKTFDQKIQFKTFKKDGDMINPGDIITIVEGKARTILTCERTALNFIQRLSGIATIANKYQNLVKDYGVKILDTRKTSPILRDLEKYAVRTGGAYNHRAGLYDMVMIKDNHIRVAGSIKKAIELAKNLYPNLKIEVEAENLDMVNESLTSGADRIMLDNMSLTEIKKAIKLINKKVETEISGGVNFNNIVELAKTGVDYISIGAALTNSSKSLDISMDINI